MRIRFRENGLAGHLYTARRQIQDKADKLAIVCPGLPYVPAEEHVTTVLLDHAIDVVQIQYMGTYDSDGSFDPESAIASVRAALDICATSRIYDPKTGVDVPLGPQVDLLIGHSFGSYIALASVSRGIAVPTVLVAAPYFCFGSLRRKAGIKADLSRHANYIHETMPKSIRMTSVEQWQRFFLEDELEAIDSEMLTDVEESQIVSVVGERDPSIDVEGLSNYISGLASSLHKQDRRLHIEPLIVVPNAGHGLESTISDSLIARLPI